MLPSNFLTIYIKPKANDDGEVFESIDSNGNVCYRFVDKYDVYHFYDQQPISLGTGIEITEDMDSEVIGMFRMILN